jgi:hypothetical protein
MTCDRFAEILVKIKRFLALIASALISANPRKVAESFRSALDHRPPDPQSIQAQLPAELTRRTNADNTLHVVVLGTIVRREERVNQADDEINVRLLGGTQPCASMEDVASLKATIHTDSPV